MGRKKGRHGGFLYLKRGEMPEGCEAIRQGIARLSADLADEFAGSGSPLTAAQIIMIDRVCQLEGFVKLVEREVWKNGPVVLDETGAPTVAPALGKFYIAATNAIAKALRTLSEVSGQIEGGKQTPDLQAYLLTKKAGRKSVRRVSDDPDEPNDPDDSEAPPASQE